VRYQTVTAGVGFGKIAGMEFRHLQSFAAAAERQSFTKAAKSLDLTQAAVSQHVAVLEKWLKVLLFERVGRTVVLTAAGRQLHDYARKILDLVDEAGREVGKVATDIAGTMRIASSTVPAESVLPELLADFRALHPDVRETVTVSDSGAATAAVELGEADLGFVGELPRSSQLRSRSIATDKLVLVVAPQHALSGSKKTSLRRLRSEPLIVREPGSGSRRCVEQALEAAGLAPDELNIAMEINSNDAIRAAVEGGLGAAFLSKTTILHEIDEGRLVPVTVAGVRPQRKLYVITDPNRIPNSMVREFLAFVSQRQERPSR
jgi:DNA-binding transcriptional LysR family regulator